MAALCYVCGEPAEGECLVCGKAFCAVHGQRLCNQCGEQDDLERRAEAYEGLPSPLFFRGALAIAILAVVLEIGWDAYRSVSTPAARVYVQPTAIGVIQTTPKAQTTAQAQTTPGSAQPTPQVSVPAGQPTVQATPTPEPPKPTPTPAPPTPTPAGGTKYVVQSGDMLVAIAAKFGVTWQAISEANGGLDPTKLQVGQTLIIPPKQ